MTIGQKIKDFVFTNPTENMVGLPPSKEHLTKEQTLEKIHDAWDHPLRPNYHHDEHPHSQEHQPAKQPHKTLGQKIMKFLFEAPTEETLGLPKGSQQKLSKEEALEKINDAWEHPIHPDHHIHDPKKPLPPAAAAADGNHRTLGETIQHYVCDAPTEEELGLPHGSKEHASKEETMDIIHDALEHPLAGA